MKSHNGVRIYEQGEAIQFPDDCPELPWQDHDAVFGFKTIKGKETKIWIHATEEDFREVHGLLGTARERVEEYVQQRYKRDTFCQFTAPQRCGGNCGPYAACFGILKPGDPNTIVFCQCQ
jgi:hypothetical protein